MTSSALHLENLLGLWEDFCFLQGTAIEYHLAMGVAHPTDFGGGYRHWQSLRADILRWDSFDRRKYALSVEHTEDLGAFAAIPQMVGQWCQSSRRVFQLSRELQALLLATSVKNMTFDDVHLPFPSFLLELARPIEDPEGHVIDSVLVVTGPETSSKGEVKHWFRLFSLPGRHIELPRLHMLERKRLRELKDRKDWVKVGKEVGVLAKRIFARPVTGIGFTLEEVRHQSVMKPFAALVAVDEPPGPARVKREEFVFKLIHLVAGFCFYLRTLPSPDFPASSWKKLPKTKNLPGHAVVSEALICAVESSYKISAQDLVFLEEQSVRELDEDGRSEASTHFRRGHWRRAPGKGDDPKALKTVRVSWTIVRPDRLPDDSLPVGVVGKVI